jgi:hypothetical protein
LVYSTLGPGLYQAVGMLITCALEYVQLPDAVGMFNTWALVALANLKLLDAVAMLNTWALDALANLKLPDAVGMLDTWALDSPADGTLFTGNPILPTDKLS